VIPGVVSAALDVEGAISAAAAGGLARGLILAALTVVLVVAIRFLFSSLAKKAKTSNSSEAKTSSALPVRVVLASSSAVGAIGSIIGILATWSSKSILVGGEVVSFFLDGLGLWSLLSLILFAAVIVLSLRNKGSKSTKYLASISAIVLSASLVAGLTLTGELTRPAGWAESKTTFNDSVSATAVMTPGAQGLNSIAVGLSGSDSDIEPIRQQIQAGLATATLVSLEQDLKSEPVAVALDDQGGLIVKDITAEAPGRWRIQIDFGDNGALLMLDVTLAPNPGYSK
jgi:hypothetical protein